MGYEKIYYDLMVSRQGMNRLKGGVVYYEWHHIVPAYKFANEQYPNGRDNPAANHPSNLVLLTAREHFIAHLLLWKFDPCDANTAALVGMTQWNQKGDRHVPNARQFATIREQAAKLSSKTLRKQWQDPEFRAEQSRRTTERNLSPEFNKFSSDLMTHRHHHDPEWQKAHSERSSIAMINRHQDPDFSRRRDERGRGNMHALWAKKKFVEKMQRVGSEQMRSNWSKECFRKDHSARMKMQRNDPVLDAPRRAGLNRYNNSTEGSAQKIETAKKINGDYVFERPMSYNSPISQERYAIAPWVYKWWLSVNHLSRGAGRKAAASFFGYEQTVAWQHMIDSFRTTGDAIFNNAKWRERFGNNPQFAEAQQAAADLVKDL